MENNNNNNKPWEKVTRVMVLTECRPLKISHYEEEWWAKFEGQDSFVGVDEYLSPGTYVVTGTIMKKNQELIDIDEIRCLSITEMARVVHGKEIPKYKNKEKVKC